MCTTINCSLYSMVFMSIFSSSSRYQETKKTRFESIELHPTSTLHPRTARLFLVSFSSFTSSLNRRGCPFWGVFWRSRSSVKTRDVKFSNMEVSPKKACQLTMFQWIAPYLRSKILRDPFFQSHANLLVRTVVGDSRNIQPRNPAPKHQMMFGWIELLRSVSQAIFLLLPYPRLVAEWFPSFKVRVEN